MPDHIVDYVNRVVGKSNLMGSVETVDFLGGIPMVRDADVATANIRAGHIITRRGKMASYSVTDVRYSCGANSDLEYDVIVENDCITFKHGSAEFHVTFE